MGFFVEYDDNVKRPRTNLLFLPTKEPMSLLGIETNLLEKVKIIVPRKANE